MNEFDANKTNGGNGGAIVLSNLTDVSNIKYTNITAGSAGGRAQLNELFILNSTGKVNLSNSTIYQNDNSSELELDTGVNIRENVNAIRLGKATLSMASYRHIAHSNIKNDENILIQENTGDYIIGVENNESSYISLKQGKIDGNTLDGTTRLGDTAVAVGNIAYDAAFGYIGVVGDVDDMKQSTIQLGGNIKFNENKRSGDILANMPVEIVPDEESNANPLYRHFNATMIPVATESFVEASTAEKTDDLLTLKDGVTDTRLGRDARISLTAINSRRYTYPDYEEGHNVRAAKTTLFKYDNDENIDYIKFDNRYIQGYDGGTGGAGAQSIFKLERKGHMVPSPGDGNEVYENRVVYANRGSGDRMTLSDSATLITFRFKMVFETDREKSDKGYGTYVDAIPDQMVEQGTNVMQPIKDYSLAEESSAIYTDNREYKVIDIVGNSAGPGDDPSKRFHSWDWTQKIYRPEGTGTEWAPELTAIYANVNHKHKVCGVEWGIECNHLGDNRTNFHKEFGGDCLRSDNTLDKTCVDVRIPEQLMYAKEHPEYMYVLGADIIITDEIDGVKIDKVLNDPDKPITDLKLCLNGHKIIMESTQTLFSLAGDCYICDCQANHGTIQYTATASTIPYDATTGNIFAFGASESEIDPGTYVDNILNIFGKNGAEADPYITFSNLRIGNANRQGFITGLDKNNIDNKINFEYVKFTSGAISEIDNPIFELAGSAAFDNLVVDGISFEKENKSIIDLRERNDVTANEYNIRSGKYINNTVNSLNSSVLRILAKDGESNILIQDDASDTSDNGRVHVKNNTMTNCAAFRFGYTSEAYDKPSNTRFTMKSVDFDYNTVRDGVMGTYDVYGTALMLENIYGSSQTGMYSISDCKFTNNGYKIYDGAGNYANYNKALDEGSTKVLGAAIYMIGNQTSGSIPYTDLEVNESLFEKNFAYKGGAIYLENSRGVRFQGETADAEDAFFKGNFAKEGSVLYADSTREDVIGKGSIIFVGQRFLDNGINYGASGAVVKTSIQQSESMMYYAGLGTSNSEGSSYVQLRLISPVIKYNYANDGLIKLGNAGSSEEQYSLVISGTDASGSIEYNGLYCK